MKFEPKGPQAYRHQRRALKKMIDTHGRTALLLDPGLGKSRVVLDYSCLLALKSERNEARVLVIAPLAAVDTWVLQASEYVSEQVSVWAEAIGGSTRQKAETLASRGGKPLKRLNPPGPKKIPQGPRGEHYSKSYARYIRGSNQAFDSGDLTVAAKGPDVLGDDKPRLLIETVNVDTFSNRRLVSKSKTMADVLLDAVKRYDPDLIVIDESHLIKNPQSNVSRFASRLVDVCDRRTILTGTVMPHSPLDIFAQWRFVDPYVFGRRMADGSWKPANTGSFKSQYAKFGGWMGKEVIGFKNLDDMQRLMSKNSVVAKKEDSLDLPKTSDVIVPVTPTYGEVQAYENMRDTLVTWLDDSGVSISTTNRLTQLLRLRQITSGFVTDDTGSVQDLGLSKVKTIASIVNETLISETRVVVFAFFTHEIEELTEALKCKDTDVMVITGKTSSTERQHMRQRFGSDDNRRIVMIAQIKTMSLAVNELVTASHAVFASMSQQRDDYVQARDRLDRIGQTKPVTFWHAVMDKTVDQVILDTHRDRGNLEHNMLRHVRGEI